MSIISQLGEAAVSAIRGDFDAEEKISTITGYSLSYIRKALENLHGKTRIKNAFASKWPDLSDPSLLGELKIIDARQWVLRDEIAAITGLSIGKVTQAVNQAHGGTFIKNAFIKYWPTSAAKVIKRIDPDDQEDVRDEDEGKNDEENEAKSYGTQGGEEHRFIQRMLCEIGEIKKYHVRTNHDIGAGLKPDVLWFPSSPEKGSGAVLAVEIERWSSAALQKSLSSLQHAHYRWSNIPLRIIIPASRISIIDEKISTTFYKIQHNTRVFSIESCLELCQKNDHYKLAKMLDLLNI